MAISVPADPASGRSGPKEVAVVRHPIADARNIVVGYELRFGGSIDLGDPAMDAKATSALLVEAFGDIGLETLAGRHPAWVTIARNFLVEIGPPPVRPDRAVLQIKAYHARDDLLQILQRLSRSGYTIALDEWEGDLGQNVEELMSLCSIVRVDISKISAAELPRVLRVPKMQGALLVATEVGDHAAFLRCQELGFTYFQGEYFAQPRTFKHRGVATAGLGSLRRLNELTSGEVSFEDLERIISSDVGLSLKLLRYVNSAFFSLPRNVSSVHEALSLLGVRTVRRWTTVMVLASIPDVPDELVSLGLRRAHMCEILAGGTTSEEREMMFTIGLFSVADALLDMPMADVLETLPFTEELQAALLRREGPKGELLAAVTAYERGEFPTLPVNDTRPTLAGAYRAALEWADETSRAIA
ncbi:HDOD domain-containing protein [Solirubrobacter phytolaccae]|uniref:HDOD domain-containing protein n=1 Tax=Solirubrobacter phytolaccae TaxID=1404360 RepID=A0A9X3NHS0_9ACTN|nr:HDOD domain-containing protein [Solirubrobacter phytolaccae]MDA0185544.1 HDOD domain-containing protein [Solirubrobacter phytolaccae]